MADDIKRENTSISLIQNNKTIKNLNQGLIISFGAGDITYKMRKED